VMTAVKETDQNMNFRVAGANDGYNETMGPTCGCEPRMDWPHAVHPRLPPRQS